MPILRTLRLTCLAGVFLATASRAGAQTAAGPPVDASVPARPAVITLSVRHTPEVLPDSVGNGTSSAENFPPEELARRLQRLEDRNSTLAEQNQALFRELETQKKLYEQINRRLEDVSGRTGSSLHIPAELASLSGESGAGGAPSATGSDPVQTTGAGEGPQPGQDSQTPRPPKDGEAPETAKESDKAKRVEESAPKFSIGGYDKERGQFVLVRPEDAQRLPFELRVDLFTQARYTNFAPSMRTWTDSTGQVRPVRSISSWEIMRNFIQFSGFALDPKLQFTAFIFSSTAINDTVYLGWINYRFSDALDVRVGNWAVPGTREWYESFRFTLGVDRSMATTFFRPYISPGVWAQGEPIKNFHYVAMVANSLNRFNQGIDRISSSFAFGGTVWWEPLGPFGVGTSDLENRALPVTRLGVSTAESREANQGTTDARLPNPEDTIVRLSDGTPLFRPGALGPGVGLSAASIQLCSLDAAFKYRGLGISGEYFLRWLDDFSTFGGAPSHSSLFDHGALLQGGYFIIPTKLESYLRSSFVTGRFGTGSEFGGGINWYPFGSRDCRLTCEVLSIRHSPAQNLLTGYRAGESGTLAQVQLFVDF